MLHERIDTGALSRFWEHIENCDECSPEGSCAECRKLLEAVRSSAKATASSSPDFIYARTTSVAGVNALSNYSDLELMRAYNAITAAGGSNERSAAVLAEISRRALSILLN
jgi:hypothetical protein